MACIIRYQSQHQPSLNSRGWIQNRPSRVLANAMQFQPGVRMYSCRGTFKCSMASCMWTHEQAAFLLTTTPGPPSGDVGPCFTPMKLLVWAPLLESLRASCLHQAQGFRRLSWEASSPVGHGFKAVCFWRLVGMRFTLPITPKRASNYTHFFY